MRTFIFPPLLLALAAGAAAGQAPTPAKDAPLDTSYLRDYAETRGFMLGRPAAAKPTPDGKAVLFLRAKARVAKMSLYEFDVASGQTRELLTPEQLLKGAEEQLSPEEKARRERLRVSVGGFTSFQLSDDGALILVSLSGKLYTVKRDGGAVTELRTGDGTLLDPKFSPDGKKVAYVLNNDVYVYDLETNKETAVTRGGTEEKPHGLAEFVAQEEMDRHSGYWWSPDAEFLAYQETDHAGVETWSVADPAHPERSPYTQFYPRPGKSNVKVRLGIVPVAGGDTVWVKFDRFEYLARVDWGKGGLVYQTQSRAQQVAEVGFIDPATGECKDRHVDSTETGWLALDPRLPKSIEFGGERGFLWARGRVDQNQTADVKGAGDRFLELITYNGERGTHRVLCRCDDFLSYDAERKQVYVQASADPTQSHVWRVTAGTEVKVEPLTQEFGHHAAAFARNHGCYVLTSTGLDAMPHSTVFDADGKRLGELPSVAEEPPFKPNVTVQKVGDGEGFWTAVVRPRDFDPKKKYPVVVDVYGGPGHLTVSRSMRAWLLMQWLADQGFVVVGIDNRGTPGRGHDWEQAVYRKFGTVPLEDQVRGLRALGKQFPEMDLDRVGIVGWSFGGYLSALAVLKEPGVFKAAVAGAPVVDWLDYDTHYTERYLGLPDTDAEAYKEASLLTYADKLERPLLLVHGTADDNVYFRHTLKLTDALFRAGKDFEVLPLSGLTHMVPDPVVTQRLWSRIAGHFQKHLGKPVEAAPPAPKK